MHHKTRVSVKGATVKTHEVKVLNVNCDTLKMQWRAGQYGHKSYPCFLSFFFYLMVIHEEP